MSTVVDPDTTTAVIPQTTRSLTHLGWQDGFHAREPREDLVEANGFSRQHRADYFRGFALGSIEALYLSKQG